jgi:hypothetical protein
MSRLAAKRTIIKPTTTRKAEGVVVSDVPNPLQATGRDPVYVGRLRRDRGLAWPRAVRDGRQPAQGAPRSTRFRSQNAGSPWLRFASGLYSELKGDGEQEALGEVA